MFRFCFTRLIYKGALQINFPSTADFVPEEPREANNTTAPCCPVFLRLYSPRRELKRNYRPTNGPAADILIYSHITSLKCLSVSRLFLCPLKNLPQTGCLTLMGQHFTFRRFSPLNNCILKPAFFSVYARKHASERRKTLTDRVLKASVDLLTSNATNC